MTLSKCPCGTTPKELWICENGQGSKYASASGDCCGEWNIEFKTQYHGLDTQECMALAVSAWNEAGRGECAMEIRQTREKEIVSKMYEARDAVIILIGEDRFKAKVNEFRPLLLEICKKEKINQIQAVTKILRSLEGQGTEMMLAMATCTEIMEPSLNKNAPGSQPDRLGFESL